MTTRQTAPEEPGGTERPTLSLHVHPTLPVLDVERAARFYTEVLGLRPMGGPALPGYRHLDCGGGTFLLLYERPDPPKADNTAASFVVDDLEAAIAGLREAGVELFEIEEGPARTEDGIADLGVTRAAWFRDTEGNILALDEPVADPKDHLDRP